MKLTTQKTFRFELDEQEAKNLYDYLSQVTYESEELNLLYELLNDEFSNSMSSLWRDCQTNSS